jgi:hypothetical protein
MPKILGNGLGKYNKSYSAPHQEYNKIEFAFFPNFLRFSRDFIRFDKSVILLKMFFCAGAPRSFSTFTTIPLVCTEHPRKNWGLAILPLAMGGGGWPESGEAGGAPGRGDGRARPRPHLWRRGGRSWGGWVAGEGARWRPAVTIAAARGDGEEGVWLGNAQPGAVLSVLGKVLTHAVAKRASKATAC